MKILIYCAALLLLPLGQISAIAQDDRQGAAEPQDLGNTPGAVHNQGVQFVLQHIQVLPPPSEVDAVLLQLTKDFCATIKHDCSTLSLPPENLSPEEVLATIHGSKTFKEAVKLLFRLNANLGPNATAPGLSLQQYEISLTDLETIFAGQLSGNERARFLGGVSIARMSALFWASSEEGGLNGAHFLNVPNLPPRPCQVCFINDALIYFVHNQPFMAIIASARSLLNN